MKKLGLLLVVLALVLSALPAWAGPESPMLLQADPADGAKLKTAPDSVTLTFDEPLDGAYSRIEVYDACGNRVDKGGATTTALQISVDLVRKPKGKYSVYYVASMYPKGATGQTNGYLHFTATSGKACKPTTQAVVVKR
ncbi:MAG TPA: copper resistance CopC family protein [Actinomycetota bacterium]|nr:copper resistance CopC family protein [Actinomycetota bacterium]